MVRPEALQGLEGHPKALKSTRTGPPRRPKGALEEPQGTPRAAKGPQRAPRGSPKATLRGVWGDQIKQKSVTEAKKVDFGKSAPRLGPADARSTLDPLKSLQNLPRMVQSGFLSRLRASFGHFWSLKNASGALESCLGSTASPYGAPKRVSFDFHSFQRTPARRDPR